jgi:hypothetical protein
MPITTADRNTRSRQDLGSKTTKGASAKPIRAEAAAAGTQGPKPPGTRNPKPELAVNIHVNAPAIAELLTYRATLVVAKYRFNLLG